MYGNKLYIHIYHHAVHIMMNTLPVLQRDLICMEQFQITFLEKNAHLFLLQFQNQFEAKINDNINTVQLDNLNKLHITIL